MSSNGKGGPHNMKKGKGVAQPKHWLRLGVGDCASSFEAALAPTDYDDDDRLFFDPNEFLFSTSDNFNAHGHTDLIDFPTTDLLLLDDVVNETTHDAQGDGGKVPIPIIQTPRNDAVVVQAARSAGSDASVNSYAVNAAGEADRRHEMDIGLFEELWEVVDAAAGGDRKHD